MIKEKINELIKDAMKSGDKVRLETLRSIRAAFIEFEKSGANKDLTEEEEIKIINTLVKKRKESIEIFEKAGRDDLATKEKSELEILKSFLPEQLSEDEISKIVDDLMQKTGLNSAKDFGKIMGLIMKELKGRADGSVVQSIVKAKLNG